MKKLLSLILIVVLSLSVMACSSSDTTQYNDDDVINSQQENNDQSSGSGETQTTVSNSEYGADSLEELYEVLKDLSIENSYKYVTYLSLFFQLDSDETMMRCLMNPGKNLEELIKETGDHLVKDTNYYYDSITVTDVVKLTSELEYLERNYLFAYDDFDKIENSDDLRAAFEKEYEGIEEIFEIRGEICYRRYSSNSNKASTSYHKLAENYYKKNIEVPYIFKINGKYFLGFLWC